MSKTRISDGVEVKSHKKQRRAKGSKKGRKIGRDKVKCLAYRNSGKREENKKRREARRLHKLEKRELRRSV